MTNYSTVKQTIEDAISSKFEIDVYLDDQDVERLLNGEDLEIELDNDMLGIVSDKILGNYYSNDEGQSLAYLILVADNDYALANLQYRIEDGQTEMIVIDGVAHDAYEEVDFFELKALLSEEIENELTDEEYEILHSARRLSDLDSIANEITRLANRETILEYYFNCVHNLKTFDSGVYESDVIRIDLRDAR